MFQDQLTTICQTAVGDLFWRGIANDPAPERNRFGVQFVGDIDASFEKIDANRPSLSRGTHECRLMFVTRVE